MDTTRHAGKTAIVTGAGSGIGRATMLRLAGDDLPAAVADRPEFRQAIEEQDPPRASTATGCWTPSPERC